MKFIVELDDFWLGEDENINEELRDYIVTNVVRKISERIKDDVERLTEVLFKNEVEKSLKRKISHAVRSFVKKQKIKKRQYGSNDDLVTIQEYLIEHTNASPAGEELKRHIEKIAEGQVKSIKEKYDLYFASQIVSKMTEKGLVKDDVKALLNM